MTPDPRRRPTGPHPRAATTTLFPLGLWVIWTLTVIATAGWVAWPALQGREPLDTLRLVIMSGLVGVGGLLVLTIIEIRLTPWRFLD